MPKGVPWSVEEEKQLREMVQEHKRLSEIAEFFGKSPESIKKKIGRLKLVVVVRQIQQTTTSNESFFNGCYEHPKAPTERTQRTFIGLVSRHCTRFLGVWRSAEP